MDNVTWIIHWHNCFSIYGVSSWGAIYWRICAQAMSAKMSFWHDNTSHYTPVRQGLPLVYDQLATNFYMSSPYNRGLMVPPMFITLHYNLLTSSIIANAKSIATGFWTFKKTWWWLIFHWRSHNYPRTQALKKVTSQTTLLAVAHGGTIVVW